MDWSHKEWLKRYLEELQLHVLLTGHVKELPQWRHTNHIPSNSCMYLIEEGKGWIKVRDQEFDPQPGEIYLLPAGELISYSNSPNNTFRKYFCHFHARIGQFQLFQLLEVPFCIRPDDPSRFERLFRELNESFHHPAPFSTLKTKALMYELLLLTLEESAGHIRRAPSSANHRLSEILQYIEQHLSENLTVEQIAKAFNYSPKYFFRLFKSSLNASPHQYINRIKMEKAKQLMISTDKSLSEIAEEVGMERAHFSRLFKQVTGASPSEYRSWKR